MCHRCRTPGPPGHAAGRKMYSQAARQMDSTCCNTVVPEMETCTTGAKSHTDSHKWVIQGVEVVETRAMRWHNSTDRHFHSPVDRPADGGRKSSTKEAPVLERLDHTEAQRERERHTMVPQIQMDSHKWAIPGVGLHSVADNSTFHCFDSPAAQLVWLGRSRCKQGAAGSDWSAHKLALVEP